MGLALRLMIESATVSIVATSTELRHPSARRACPDPESPRILIEASGSIGATGLRVHPFIAFAAPPGPTPCHSSRFSMRPLLNRGLHLFGTAINSS
jgi:hypothetical protein